VAERRREGRGREGRGEIEENERVKLKD